jgi:hypothetical protein
VKIAKMQNGIVVNIKNTLNVTTRIVDDMCLFFVLGVYLDLVRLLVPFAAVEE